MNCRDVRDLAGSFVGEELLTETNHEILRHLSTCPSCRTEIEGRRRLRAALQTAFERSADLQPPPEFAGRLRQRLRDAAATDRRSRLAARRWWALAAGVVLAAGLSAVAILHRSVGWSESLVRDAVGDHRNCALKFRLVRLPVPLEEAAQQFDSAYRLLLDAPPDAITTPDGTARVTERHSCAFGERRFGHVIMEYQGHAVSLLLTSNEGAPRATGSAAIAPQVIGRPIDGLSVVSVNRDDHAVLLVSDLDIDNLTRLSRAVSVPVAQRLEAQASPNGRAMATLFMR